MEHVSLSGINESESQPALLELAAFERAEVDRMMTILANDEKHRVDHSRWPGIQRELEGESTVRIDKPEFTIKRNPDHGFTFTWKDTDSRAH